jgi:PiT family inorganic phosphate transporter
VALAHGANDVANAMGPLAGIYIIYVTHAVSPEVPVPFFLLALGGFAGLWQSGGEVVVME